MASHHSPTHLHSGVLAALPIAMGYIPAAFAYGVLAEQAGLSGIAATLMSVMVFAGASQYVAVGFVASGMLPDLRVLGFDFALPAMFIALLVTQIRGDFFLLSAGYAGLIAVGFSLSGSTTLAVIAATLVGATSGLVNELWVKRSAS